MQDSEDDDKSENKVEIVDGAPAAGTCGTTGRPLEMENHKNNLTDAKYKKKKVKLQKSRVTARSAVVFEDTCAEEVGTVTVEDSKVREATGAALERWRCAAESEYTENFLKMNAFTETTPEELAAIGGQSKVLPMKCVWTWSTLRRPRQPQ